MSVRTMSPGTISASAMRAIDDPITRANWSAGVGASGPERLHPLKQPERFEVEIGKGEIILVDVGKPEGPPEALQQVGIDAR